MRAGGDPTFQEVLKNVRSTEAQPPIPRECIRDLTVLSTPDIRADPTRASAPILVLGIQERHRLNKHKAYAFAKYHDVPLVRWKLPLARKDAASISDEVLTNPCDNEPGMWGYFVRGAPSMLLRNIQPTKHLANGSMGWLDSLTFDPEPPPEILAAVQAEHFQVTTLDEPPFSVNIVPQLPDDDTGEGIQSLIDDWCPSL